MLINGVCIGLLDGSYPSVRRFHPKGEVVRHPDCECVHPLINTYGNQTLWGGSEEEI